MNARRHFKGCTEEREGETLILTNILLFSKPGKPCVHQETWEVLTANTLLRKGSVEYRNVQKVNTFNTKCNTL